MFIDFILDVIRENREKIAIIYKDNEYTYGWLLNAYLEGENFIREKGIPQNSVVALSADFTPKSVGLLLALVNNGTIFVPISPAVKDSKELIDIAEVEYAITIEEDNINLEKRNIQVEHEILTTLKTRKSPGLVLFSSGTTGKPKGAVHDLVPLLQKFKIPGKSSRTITFLLFDHIGGFNTLIHILANAGTLVTVQSRLPEEVCRLIEKYDVELLPTSPTFVNMILFSRAYEKYDITSLKIVSYGTEPMPEATLKNFHQLFPNINLKQTYGLSELGIMRSKSESSDSLWIKIGGEDYKTKIVDGKLCIKAKSAMIGYLNAPSPFDGEGWFNTNDRVEQKGDYIRFLGRESDIINVGGEKVYPIEVESVLLEIDGIKDASVGSEKHPLMGNIVIANVSVGENNNNKEFIGKIKKHCRERLEKYKVPVKVNLTSNVFNSERFKRLR